MSHIWLFFPDEEIMLPPIVSCGGWLIGGNLMAITNNDITQRYHIRYTSSDGYEYDSLSDQDWIWDAAVHPQTGRIVVVTRFNLESDIIGDPFIPAAYSDDGGLTWTYCNQILPEYVLFNDIVYSDDYNKFMAVGEQGVVFTSVDGETWIQVRGNGLPGFSHTTPDINCVTSNQGIYLIGTYDGKIYSAFSDETQWTLRFDNPSAGQVYNIAFSGTSIVAVCQNGWYRSVDFINWIDVTPTGAKIINGLTYMGYSGTVYYDSYNNKYFIGAMAGEIYESIDEGLTWQLLANNPLQLDRATVISQGSFNTQVSVISYNSDLDKYLFMMLDSPNGKIAVTYNDNTNQWGTVISDVMEPPYNNFLSYMRFAIPVKTCLPSNPTPA